MFARTCYLELEEDDASRRSRQGTVRDWETGWHL